MASFFRFSLINRVEIHNQYGAVKTKNEPRMVMIIRNALFLEFTMTRRLFRIILIIKLDHLDFTIYQKIF